MRADFMKRLNHVEIAAVILGFAMSLVLNAVVPDLSLAASASAINRDATASLNKLYAHTPGAKALADKAVGVLIFPSIVKGGFIIAGQFGDGALR